jgi:hypothetical protein
MREANIDTKEDTLQFVKKLKRKKEGSNHKSQPRIL